MRAFALRVAVWIMAIIYAPLKLFSQDPNKVVFLSRQSDTPSLDFRMLMEEIKRQNPDAKIVCICNRIGKGLASKVSYGCDLLRSLYHLATSKVCVLDSYWPAVSTLHHKDGLVVIQIWHSLGKVKQSGWQAVGRPGGRPEDEARAMRMHANYDYIVAGAPAWNQFYCEGFHCHEEQILNFALPRLDVIVSGQEKTAEKILERYPELCGKKVVVYAPTFRRGEQNAHFGLATRLDANEYALVVKAHPNQGVEAPGCLTCKGFSTMQLLSVADVVITDYSSVAVEAAAANVPTLYYLYDYEKYLSGTGLNINIPAEMPSCVMYDEPSLAEAVRKVCAGDYPWDELARYRERYVIADPGHSTRDIASFVVKHLGSGAEAEAMA